MGGGMRGGVGGMGRVSRVGGGVVVAGGVGSVLRAAEGAGHVVGGVGGGTAPPDQR